MSDNMSRHRPFDCASEGATARSTGQPKDSCPYPAGSRERAEWIEGFEGMESDRPPDLPIDQTG